MDQREFDGQDRWQAHTGMGRSQVPSGRLPGQHQDAHRFQNPAFMHAGDPLSQGAPHYGNAADRDYTLQELRAYAADLGADWQQRDIRSHSHSASQQQQQHQAEEGLWGSQSRPVASAWHRDPVGGMEPMSQQHMARQVNDRQLADDPARWHMHASQTSHSERGSVGRQVQASQPEVTQRQLVETVMRVASNPDVSEHQLSEALAKISAHRGVGQQQLMEALSTVLQSGHPDIKMKLLNSFSKFGGRQRGDTGRQAVANDFQPSHQQHGPMSQQSRLVHQQADDRWGVQQSVTHGHGARMSNVPSDPYAAHESRSALLHDRMHNEPRRGVSNIDADDPLNTVPAYYASRGTGGSASTPSTLGAGLQSLQQARMRAASAADQYEYGASAMDVRSHSASREPDRHDQRSQSQRLSHIEAARPDARVPAALAGVAPKVINAVRQLLVEANSSDPGRSRNAKAMLQSNSQLLAVARILLTDEVSQRSVQAHGGKEERQSAPAAQANGAPRGRGRPKNSKNKKKRPAGDDSWEEDEEEDDGMDADDWVPPGKQRKSARGRAKAQRGRAARTTKVADPTPTSATSTSGWLLPPTRPAAVHQAVSAAPQANAGREPIARPLGGYPPTSSHTASLSAAHATYQDARDFAVAQQRLEQHRSMLLNDMRPSSRIAVPEPVMQRPSMSYSKRVKDSMAVAGVTSIQKKPRLDRAPAAPPHWTLMKSWQFSEGACARLLPLQPSPLPCGTDAVKPEGGEGEPATPAPELSAELDIGRDVLVKATDDKPTQIDCKTLDSAATQCHEATMEAKAEEGGQGIRKESTPTPVECNTDACNASARGSAQLHGEPCVSDTMVESPAVENAVDAEVGGDELHGLLCHASAAPLESSPESPEDVASLSTKALTEAVNVSSTVGLVQAESEPGVECGGVPGDMQGELAGVVSTHTPSSDVAAPPLGAVVTGQPDQVHTLEIGHSAVEQVSSQVGSVHETVLDGVATCGSAVAVKSSASVAVSSEPASSACKADAPIKPMELAGDTVVNGISGAADGLKKDGAVHSADIENEDRGQNGAAHSLLVAAASHMASSKPVSPSPSEGTPDVETARQQPTKQQDGHKLPQDQAGIEPADALTHSSQPTSIEVGKQSPPLHGKEELSPSEKDVLLQQEESEQPPAQVQAPEETPHTVLLATASRPGSPVGPPQESHSARNVSAEVDVKPFGWPLDSAGLLARQDVGTLTDVHGPEPPPPIEESDDDSDDDKPTLWSVAKLKVQADYEQAVRTDGEVLGVTDRFVREKDELAAMCSTTVCADNSTAGGTVSKPTRRRSQASKGTALAGAAGVVKKVSLHTALQEADHQASRFVAKPSAIAGLGAYTKVAIPAKEILLEYRGVLIRSVHQNKLEAKYEKEGKDFYLFTVDGADYLVDATDQGGFCRFVNHSCSPNCEVKTVVADGQRRIVLRSIRNIKAGEELTYDYRLSYDPEKAIKCRCGSAKCRIWL